MAPRLAKALSKFRVSKRNPLWRKIDKAYGIGYLWSFHDGVWGYGATAIFAAVVGLPNNLKGPHNVVWFGFLSMRLADTGRCWDSSFETREGCTTSHFKTANSEGKFWSCHPRIRAAISQPGLNLWQVPAAGHYYTFHYRWDDERCKLLARSLAHPSAEWTFQSYMLHMIDSVHGIFGDQIRYCEYISYVSLISGLSGRNLTGRRASDKGAIRAPSQSSANPNPQVDTQSQVRIRSIASHTTTTD